MVRSGSCLEMVAEKRKEDMKFDLKGYTKARLKGKFPKQRIEAVKW